MQIGELDSIDITLSCAMRLFTGLLSSTLVENEHFLLVELAFHPYLRCLLSGSKPSFGDIARLGLSSFLW